VPSRGRRHRRVAAPVYSHLVYDVVPGEEQVIESPDILIVEGLNVLQPARLPRVGERIAEGGLAQAEEAVDVPAVQVVLVPVEIDREVEEVGDEGDRGAWRSPTDSGRRSTCRTCATTSCPRASGPV
jgi:hypothetical protein